VSESATDEGRPFKRLPRAFRLKRQRLIRPLFTKGTPDVGSVARGCVRLVYRVVTRRESEANVPILIGFSAGRGGSAPRRNRIKRVLKEVYRVHQQALMDLFSDGDRTLTIMVLYRRRSTWDERCIREDLPEALAALASSFNKT
jgi:ribonuclease P protein component